MEIIERPVWSSRAWLVAVAVLVALVLVVALLNPGLGDITITFLLSAVTALAIGVTGWALLRTRRQRRAYEQRLEEWAAERAVQEERLRIARDLHDLASAGLGLMTVRASYARLTDDEQDAERRQALTDIEQVGREAITELRQMLSLLRGAGADDAPLRPAATLDDLPGIIAAARRSGLTIIPDLADIGRVPPGMQLTICSVVREALANAARHAGPTTVYVTLGSDQGAIRLDIQDRGAGPGWRPQPGAGYGLTGLRERLALHHGTLTSDTTEEGFRLLAELPVRQESG